MTAPTVAEIAEAKSAIAWLFFNRRYTNVCEGVFYDPSQLSKDQIERVDMVWAELESLGVIRAHHTGASPMTGKMTAAHLEAAAKQIGPMQLRVTRCENYSGEHREWTEYITLPKGCYIFAEIVAALTVHLATQIEGADDAG
jgi:hypothetical protein